MNPFELIQKGDMEALKSLIEKDPQLARAKNESGVSPLMFAAYVRNPAAIEIIKTHVPNVNIFEACAIGDLDALNNLLKDNSILNDPSPDGFSPLGLACFFGNQPVVELLIEKGADVNQPSDNDFKVAPLHSACAIAHVEIADLLIEQGADVNAAQQSGVTPLHSAAHNGSLPLVELLVSNGADIDLESNDGKNALTYAQEKNFEHLYELLS